MAQIHPTAIVDSQVQLADDVYVGPGCILEGNVQIGPGTHLHPYVMIRGPVRIGSDNQIFPHAVIGYPPQDRKFDLNDPTPGVVIGDRNIIRESSTLSAATGNEPTRLGNDNMLMVNAHVAHDCRVGDQCVLVNGAMMGGHAILEDQVMLGGNAAVHQYCRVGRLAIISGLSGISQDLPPFCTCHNIRRVGALNLIGLRRAGLREHIQPLKLAFDILYRQYHARSAALELIEKQLGHDPLCQEFVRFIRDSKRGVTGYTRSRDFEHRIET